MLFKKILSFFNPITQVVKAITPAEPIFVDATDKEMEVLLKTVIQEFSYFTFHKSRYDWRKISPVKVTQRFSGWGYVEGRTQALYINEHVSLCQADDDMDFTEMCVLVDGIPAMLLYSGRKGALLLHLIGSVEDGSLASLLNLGGVDISSVEAFNKVPSVPRRILVEVFRGLASQTTGEDAMEAMFRYAHGEKA